VTRVVVNGRACELAAPARLLDALREGLGLVGTREGCGAGECGACHVLVDGRSVASCDLAVEACEGHAVTTVEGLDGRLRAAFAAEQAAQCGYCSSGMLVAAAALLRANTRPSEAEVKAALERHLCRCGAHPRIVRAVKRAAEAMA
jgi:nicotinate dehydrogenase subunit A